MRKAFGIDPGLFLPEEACRNLIKRSIDQFKKPSLKCSELVYKELDEAIIGVMSPGLEPRNSLRNFLRDTMEKLIEENRETLKEFITQRIESEKEYINYDDEDFSLIKPHIITDEDPDEQTLRYLKQQYKIDPSLFIEEKVYEKIDTAIENARKAMKKSKKPSHHDDDDMDPWDVEKKVDISKGLSSEDYKNIMSMKRVIHSYFSILKKDFKANVPKYIIKFLVRTTINRMRVSMQMALRKHEDIISLVYEDPEIRKQREISQNSLRALKQAMKAIKSVKRGKEDIYT